MTNTLPKQDNNSLSNFVEKEKSMIWIPAAVCAAYNIVYIVHCLKFKRFRAAVGMALLAAAVAAAVISIQLNRL